jgi:hypothetical protein
MFWIEMALLASNAEQWLERTILMTLVERQDYRSGISSISRKVGQTNRTTSAPFAQCAMKERQT